MWLKTLALTVVMGAAVALGLAPTSAEAHGRRYYYDPYYGYTYHYPYGYSYYGYSYPYRSYYYGAPYRYGYHYGYYPYYGRRGAYIGPNSAFFYGPRGGFRIRY